MPAAAALLGTALTSTTLDAGFFWDDHILRQRLLRARTPKAALESMARLFVFVDDRSIDRLRERGHYPWWTARGLRISFFRPLSALTHILDHRLWPRSPRAMHLHNVLWYAGACFLVARFFRRTLGGGWIAGLAAVFFALDEAHYMTVLWLANRNALVALVFGMLALIAYDRWRRQGWRPGALWTLGCLALSLLSAEIGVATVAYLVGYALFLDAGGWRRRLLAAAPSVALAAAWQAAYRAGGYGVAGSDIYIDPGREPLRFTARLPRRLALLLLGQLGWKDVALYNYSSTTARSSTLASAAVLLPAMAVLGWPAWRGERTARFFAFGLFGSLLPVCAMQWAGSRMLLFAGVGATGLLAQAVAFSRRGVAALFAGLHLIRIPLRHLERSAAAPFRSLQQEQERFIDVGAGGGGREVIVVNVPNPFAFFYFEAFYSARGSEPPARLRLLAPGYFSVELERLDERTLRLRPLRGFLVPPGEGPDRRPWPAVHRVHLYQQQDRAFRSPSLPFAAGRSTVLDGMTVEPTRLTADGRPLEVRVRFAEPLESSRYRWLRWDWSENAYRVFEPPAIGARVEVEGLERRRREGTRGPVF